MDSSSAGSSAQWRAVRSGHVTTALRSSTRLGNPHGCAQQRRIYIRPAKKDGSALAQAMRYVFLGGPRADLPLFHAHVEKQRASRRRVFRRGMNKSAPRSGINQYCSPGRRGRLIIQLVTIRLETIDLPQSLRGHLHKGSYDICHSCCCRVGTRRPGRYTVVHCKSMHARLERLASRSERSFPRKGCPEHYIGHGVDDKICTDNTHTISWI